MSLLKKSAYVLLSQIASLGGLFVTGVISARALGTAGKGLLALAQTSSSLGYVILNLGLAASLTYFLAAGLITLTSARRLVFSASAAIGFLSAMFFWFAPRYVDTTLLGASSPLMLVLIAVTVPSVFLSSSLAGMCLATQDATGYARSALWQQGVYLLLVLTLFLTGGKRPESYFLALLIGTFVSIAYLLRRQRVVTGVRQSGSHKTPHPARLRRILAYGAKAWFANGMAFLHNRQDIFIVTAFLGPSAVGIYTLAVTFAELLWKVPSSVSSVLTPQVATQDDAVGSALLTARTCRVVLAASAVIAVLAWVLIEGVTRLLLPDFRSASIIMLALLPGVILFSMSPVLSSFFSGTDHVGIPSTIAFATTVVNLAANFILVPALGILGAALASTVSYTVNAVSCLLAFRRVSHVPLSEVVLVKRGDLALLSVRVRSALAATRPGAL